MIVTVEEATDGVVCHLAGNLEHGTVVEFRDCIAQLKPGNHIIFELGELHFIDSAGLGALIGAVRRIREMSGDVVLCSAKPSVNKVFHIVGLPRLVAVLDSLADARSHSWSRHVA